MFDPTRKENVDNEIKDYLTRDRNELTDDDFADNPPRSKKRFLLIGAALLVLLAAGLYSLYTGHKSFAREQVTISIETPAKTGSGDEDSLVINCANANAVALSDARLEIFLPSNFVFTSSDQPLTKNGSVYYWEVGTVPASDSRQLRIFGKAIGRLGDTQSVRAVLRYRPANFNSQFQAEGRTDFTIDSVPVELTAIFPDSLRDSSEGELLLSYKNTSKRVFSKASLELEFPGTFVLASSEPLLKAKEGSENTFVTEEADLRGGNTRSVKIRGAFQSQNDKEVIKARLYLMEDNGEMIEYAFLEKDVRLEKTEILVSQTVNGHSEYDAESGEELTYRIAFKNQSGADIKDLRLTSTLDGAFELIDIEPNAALVSGQQLIWNADKVPALKLLTAGEEGSVEFKAKVIDLTAQVRKDSDKNYTLKNTAVISSGALQIKNEQNTKVRADLRLDAKGYFNDDGRIPNGGALPPRVGQQTYYTIHWSLRSALNDIENIRITSVLPQGVGWTGRYIDSQGKVRYADTNKPETSAPTETVAGMEAGKITEERFYYNSDTNSLIWELPALKANAGLLTAAKELVFQVEATPSAQQAGSAMPLTGSVLISAYDNFVLKEIGSSLDKTITTRLEDDFSIGSDEALVLN